MPDLCVPCSPIPCPAIYLLACAQRAKSRTEAEGIGANLRRRKYPCATGPVEPQGSDSARYLGETVRWLTHLPAKREVPSDTRRVVSHETPNQENDSYIIR